MGRNNNRLSFNIAYCGIITALAVIIMFAALIPAMTYVLPAISGLLVWTISRQINRKWALLSYAAAALLCFMLVPEIEADMYFLMFFGFYPTICDLINKIKPKILAFIVKLAVFNVAVVIAFNILCLILNVGQILEGLEDFGEYAVYVLWGAANIAFICYDLCLSPITYAFDKWLKPKFNKMVRK